MQAGWIIACLGLFSSTPPWDIGYLVKVNMHLCAGALNKHEYQCILVQVLRPEQAIRM